MSSLSRTDIPSYHYPDAPRHEHGGFPCLGGCDAMNDYPNDLCRECAAIDELADLAVQHG